MHTSLQGRAEKAKSHAKYRGRHLDGRLKEERLQDGWREIRQEAADGVDEVSAHAYEQHLDANIRHLVARLQRKRDRAKLLRRHDIPTENGQRRPLGIPAGEEKLLQLAVTRLLTAIDEQDVLRCRDGDRPQVGALEAVDQRTIKLQVGRDNWVVEAAITGFFDNSDHAWMIRMVAERLQAPMWAIPLGGRSGYHRLLRQQRSRVDDPDGGRAPR